jgi:hypothetical protein
MAGTYFTLEEANKTLPLVGRIVQDIVDDYERWKDSLAAYEVVAARSRVEEGESEEAVELRKRVDDIAQQINRYIEELKQIGCVLKGFDDGLVDFHSERDGRDICLCWKLGEAEVAHWHEVDAGFSGRRPIVKETVGESGHP